MTITHLLIAPGLDESSQSGCSVCSVGLVMGGKHVAWGDCVCSAQIMPLSVADARKSIEDVVSPALVGTKLDGFREMAGAIEALRETVTREEPIPPPEENNPPEGISRRDLLRGRLRSEDTPSTSHPTRSVTSQQALHPALRYGLSQALLAAVAQDRGISIAEVVAREYDLPRPTAVIPLLAQLDTNRPLDSLAQLSSHIAAIGYTVPDGEPKEILGDNAIILQRFLRILMENVVAMPGWENPTRIHIDLRGGLGKLYGNNTGQMLGALVGLETSIKPLQLSVENPVGGDSLVEIVARTRDLREFLRFRKMDVNTAVGPVNTISDAQALIDANALDMLRIDPLQVGDLSIVIEIMLLARAEGKQVILAMDAGVSGHALQILAQVALAIQPDIVVAPAVGRNNISDVFLEIVKDVREIEISWG